MTSPLPAEEGGRPTCANCGARDVEMTRYANGTVVCFDVYGCLRRQNVPASAISRCPASVVSSEEGGRGEHCAHCGVACSDAAGLKVYANGVRCCWDAVACIQRMNARSASVVGDASEGAYLRALNEYDATVAERHAEEAGGWEKIRERNERNAEYLINLCAPDENDIERLESVATFGVIWLRDALAALRSTRAALEEARNEREANQMTEEQAYEARAILLSDDPDDYPRRIAIADSLLRALTRAIPSQESTKV